ncbi:MAG TPA: hypothetical protein VIK86_09310 [Candidatus Paceibacterota bacterium]
MNYEEAKAHKQELEEINGIDSDRLKSFDDLGKTAMGLTPEYIRTSSEWETAKNAFDSSFAELREFNTFFIKTFKKEYTAERRSNRKY